MRLFPVLLATAAFAAIPAGYSHWSATQLDERARGLPAKIAHEKVKVATDALGGWGNHSMSLVRREGPGEAELHETQSDIMFIRGGEGTIVIGGTIPNGRHTSAHEVRGASIEGGEKQPLRPGDVLHIPPRTPHQMLLEPGQHLDYVAVKVDAR